MAGIYEYFDITSTNNEIRPVCHEEETITNSMIVIVSIIVSLGLTK